MSAITRGRYALRRRSAANKFSERRATAVSESDSDMNDARRNFDDILESDADSWASVQRKYQRDGGVPSTGYFNGRSASFDANNKVG